MYIEPAAGVGIYTEKSGVYDYGYKEGYTYYMIDISLEAGYKWKNLSVAFQPQLLTDGAIPSDLWPMLSFKLGYQFPFRPRPAQPAVRSNRNSGP